jgi:hypothetical protein
MEESGQVIAYTDVIRRAEAPNADSWQRLAEDIGNELTEALAVVADLQTGLVSALTTGGRLRLERDAARLEVADVRTRLAERDAQVGRLTKRLSEGLG